MSRIVDAYRVAVGSVFVPRTADPDIANVALLLHCDGTDGQTTLADSSNSPKSVVRVGNAHVDTAITKFGTGSVNLDGTGDWIQVAHVAGLNVGSNHKYCIEGWFYVTQIPVAGISVLFTKYNFTTILPFHVYISSGSGVATFQMGSIDGSQTAQADTVTSFPLNEWVHVACARDDANVRFFINGVQVGTTDTSLGSLDGGDNTANFQVGDVNGGGSGLFGWVDEVRFTIGSARYTANFTPPTAPFWNPYVIQQAFRWYNDDGSESAMTAAAAQNSGLSGSSGTIYTLRTQLDSTGDMPSTIWRLEYRLSTASTWIPVLLAAPAAPTYQASGTEFSGTGQVSPTWPAHLPGDVGLLVVESCGGEAASLAVPAGFVACDNSPVATGSGTAGTQLSVFWCRATSDSMDTPLVDDPGDHVYARIITFRGCIAEGNPWDVSASAVKAAASTSYSAPSVVTTQANCLVVNIISRDNDAAGAGFSAQTNVSLGSLTERADGGTTSGNGGGIGLITGTLATATNSGNTTGTVTSSINAMLTLALRPQTTPIIMADSSNVTAGGQATTARLTAPTGKTTSSFTTGRMWDNENGTDAINIAADFYTELAWTLKAQSPATGGQTYQFRVTQAGTPLEYYAQVPSLTI